MMLTSESPVNDDHSSFQNLWRENLEKAQHYKVVIQLSVTYQYLFYSKNAGLSYLENDWILTTVHDHLSLQQQHLLKPG